MANNETEPLQPTYKDARSELARESATVRIYGVSLATSEDCNSLIIWYCGFRTGGLDHRKGSNRIFHIPLESVVARGETDDFDFREQRVEWIDVKPASQITEEVYQAFEASAFTQVADSQRTAGTPNQDITVLERLHGIGSPHLLPAIQGTGLRPSIDSFSAGEPLSPTSPIVVPLAPGSPSVIPLNPNSPSVVPLAPGSPSVIPLNPN